MPLANVRGVNINYEVLGDTGPWVALSPGGRRGLDAVKSLAGRVAAAGYRVLIHDRRNCGASDVVIDVMTQWREHFIRGADQPVIGASAATRNHTQFSPIQGALACHLQ